MLKQSPAAYTKQPQGTTVVITVSDFTTPTPTPTETPSRVDVVTVVARRHRRHLPTP